MQCFMRMCPVEAVETLSISKGYKWGDGARRPATEDTQTISLCAFHLGLLNEGKLKPPR